MYKNFFKRIIDFSLSLIALILFSPIFLMLSIIGAILMKGNPFFIQPRPGKKDKAGKEKIFFLIKFRTMTNEKDSNGELLPDYYRLKKYGRILRSTSLDELPSLLNILFGQLSIVGPRPQLVRDMIFMTEKQRNRHNVIPGLTGLAQVNGRNNITWEEKFDYDLKYIENITFLNDLKIIFKTIGKVLKKEDVVREGTVSDVDYGDWLLLQKKIDKKTYTKKMNEAKKILKAGVK